MKMGQLIQEKWLKEVGLLSLEKKGKPEGPGVVPKSSYWHTAELSTEGQWEGSKQQMGAETGEVTSGYKEKENSLQK